MKTYIILSPPPIPICPLFDIHYAFEGSFRKTAIAYNKRRNGSVCSRFFFYYMFVLLVEQVAIVLYFGLLVELRRE